MINWKFWKKKWKEISVNELSPQQQKQVEDVERLIKESGAEIVSRKIETDE